MKKNTLVQLIVIYIGFNSIYTGITYLMPVITAAVSHLYSTSRDNGVETVYFIAFAFCVAIGFGVVVKSGSISVYMAERAGLDDSLKIYTRPTQLLSILIVVTALGHLLNYSPSLFGDLYYALIDKSKQNPTEYLSARGGNPSFLTNLLHILFACLMIIFCRPLTQYFSKNIMLGDEEIVAEHETITIETIDKR